MAYEGISSEQLRVAGAQCNQMADLAQGILEFLHGKLADVTWTGPAADQFAQAVAEISSTISSGATSFQDAACDLACAAEAVEAEQATTGLP